MRMFLLLLTLAAASPAQAVVRCKLAYTPSAPGSTPIVGEPRGFTPLPGGRSAAIFTGADGIIIQAVATLEPMPTAQGQPTISALTLTVLLANAIDKIPATTDATRFSNYRGTLAKVTLTNPVPHRTTDVDFPTAPPGSPPGTFPDPVFKTQVEPLLFKTAATNTDFGPQALAALAGKGIARVEFFCADGL